MVYLRKVEVSTLHSYNLWGCLGTNVCIFIINSNSYWKLNLKRAPFPERFTKNLKEIAIIYIKKDFLKCSRKLLVGSGLLHFYHLLSVDHLFVNAAVSIVSIRTYMSHVRVFSEPSGSSLERPKGWNLALALWQHFDCGSRPVGVS